MLDSASRALEWPSTSPEIAALIRDAERLIEQGREEGVVAMEAALSRMP
ncbi:hypothetical protein [Microbacterium invictum]|uniref:Uncharacterized protein n=1 Tax=Microbacterium invictum TaxID=515415 RepID=A0AA40SQP7_9MICO|nr:hypothetical protein [Microbacterium invictum]MBB4140546.1 hypothetical protein [Microbacterium invictum]